MDISAIKNIATRKKTTVEMEKLREKVSKENKNIIKLKVAQDTAYWDLQERLRQVETNHGKLQQNMVEVQMQYETVSGQYQDELRLRAETLNKLTSTREICTVLEDYCERLRDTLSHCKADQAALYEAYQQSVQILGELKTRQVQQDEMSRQTIDSLQDKLKLTAEHHNQLQIMFTEEKQRLALLLQEEKNKLSSVLGKNCEMVAANTELGALVDYSRKELEKKEETIEGLQRDIKQLIQEFNSQASDMKNNMAKQEKELNETIAANESLKQALTNQETFTKSICDQNNQLQEKLAATEEEQSKAEKVVKELEGKLQQTEAVKESLQSEFESLTETNSRLEKEISNKNEIIACSETELQTLTDHLAAMDLEKSEALKALETAEVETQAMVTKVKELTEAERSLEVKIKEIEDALKKSRDESEFKIKELTLAIEDKDKDLDSKTSTIAHLINEIKTISDARANLESTIQRIRRELAEEKDAAGEREKRLEMKLNQLEITVQNKDNELSKNMSLIIELRSDKERLHEKIQSMQSKIDNIQKELTRPASFQSRITAEQDDNAVTMLTPTSKKRQIPTNKPEFEVPAAPPKEPKTDNFLFNFLSDNSMDGDNSIDPSIVNRHFEAMSRGEPLSPMPMSSLKRRHDPGFTSVPCSLSVCSTQGGLRFKQASKDEDNMKTSSQAKQGDKSSKPRMFFKNRRNEKSKRF